MAYLDLGWVLSKLAVRQCVPLSSERARIGMDVDRRAAGVEVVSHELRTSMAVEVSPKSRPCLRVVGLHIYPACDVLMMVVLLLTSLWPPSLVLGVLNEDLPCDWTPRLMAGLIAQSPS